MVQKYVVDDNHRHQMINSLCYMVYVVYFYFVEKMGNFHYNPVEGVDYLENLLNWCSAKVFFVNVFRVFDGFVIDLYV